MARERLALAALRKVEEMLRDKRVGLEGARGSQAEMYSIRAWGLPSIPGGLRDEVVEGKMVEMVPSGVRVRIRRARMADSRAVGILKALLLGAVESLGME